MRKNFLLKYNTRLNFVSPEKQSFFFGYYNYSPISANGTKLLAHKTNFEERMPNSTDKVEIGYFDLKTQIWHKISESRAFNWQQGSMLQWLGPDYNSKFIFNDVDDNKYVSRIFDINNETFKIIPHAIYGIDPQGEFSISLNFERCYWTRAYSYSSIENKKWNKNIPEEDGILKIDLKTGEAKKIVSIQKIVDLSKENDQISHWFEHILLNPRGDRFAFYHRYGTSSNFSSRIYTSDLNGENIWQHPYNNGDHYSHLGWRDNSTYVLYTIPENKIDKSVKEYENKNKKTQLFIRLYRKLLKPIIPRRIVKTIIKSNNNYVLTTDQKGIIENIDPKILPKDGHPSFSKDLRFMLTDTYEDEKGYRQLLLYDFSYNKVIQLGLFYSTYNSCGWRADLHPRFSHDEQHVIIDSTHNGHHQMLVLKINWEHIIKLN